MSSPDRNALARGARHAEALFDQEVDRLVAMSDEDFIAAMEDLAPQESEFNGGHDVLARARKVALSRGVSLRAEPGPRTGAARRFAYAVAAFAAAAGIAGLFVERHAVTAWIHGPEPAIQPDEPKDAPPAPTPAASASPPPSPAPQELALQQAVEYRRQADLFCADKEWAACLVDLNHAKLLDPAGDATPKIDAMRAVIAREGPKSPHWNGK
jgi:hypothetical protein